MKKGTIFRQEFLDTFNHDEKVFDRASLKSVIEQSLGESNELDFKEKFIKEDYIAKLILAMANSGGGSIVFGVSDDNKPVGIQKDELKDPTDFQRKINNYLPTNLNFIIQQIEYDLDETYGEFSGKLFFIFYIPQQNRYVPFIAKKSSDKLSDNKIYIRKNTSVESATNEDLENLFRKRLYEQYEDLSNLDLDEHINQLKVLYGNIDKNITKGYPFEFFSKLTQNVLGGKSEKNENYPEEEFDEFISRMIEKKKRKIEIVLEVTNID